MQKKEQQNLLDFYPSTSMEWIINDQERVVLLKPRFKSRWAERLFVPRFTSKHIKITLDQYGSWIWQRINGEQTIMAIGEQLLAEFGEEIEPVYERLGMFIKLLLRNKFITIELKEQSNE